MVKSRRLHFNWRLILVQTVANALSLGLTVLLLPNVRLQGERPVVELLVAGFVFGALNAFVRPVLQFLMFRFLFITFGLVLILINILLLWMLDWIVRDWFQADTLFAIVVAAILVGLFGTLFEIVLGLRPPIVDGHRIQPERPRPAFLPGVVQPEAVTVPLTSTAAVVPQPSDAGQPSSEQSS